MLLILSFMTIIWSKAQLTSSEIYSILISRAQNKYWLDRNLYATTPNYLQFLYEILSIWNFNNVLFLNIKLHIFGVKPSPLCSFCNLYDEISSHIFYECDRVKCLWSRLVQWFQNNLVLATLTPQTAIFGFFDSTNNDFIFENNKCLSNHSLLIFKLYVYKSGEKKFININNLTAENRKVKRIEK